MNSRALMTDSISSRNGLETCPQQETGSRMDRTLRELEAERARLAKEVVAIRAEQQQFLERYIRLEDLNSTLTTLYVASQRLHSTLDRSEVLLIVREIIANLIGCEEFALFTRLPDGGLHRVDAAGLPAGAFVYVAPGCGLIGKTVETGEAYLSGESDGSGAVQAEADLTACIPLKLDGAVSGAIAIFRLLPQKFEIQELDRELFRLLETHLALALHCAELHETARRKNGATA